MSLGQFERSLLLIPMIFIAAVSGLPRPRPGILPLPPHYPGGGDGGGGDGGGGGSS